MHDMLDYLNYGKSYFPTICRDKLKVLQVNLGYLCNQQCSHCHVNAGPKRTEIMDLDVVEIVLQFIRDSKIGLLDLTGGAPELNPHFRYLVERARALGVAVIDRCNLSVLQEEGQEGLAEFLAAQRVEIVASLPCYLEENVDGQRGKGIFADSIAGLRKLNALGYGVRESGLELNLMYNPLGPSLPPSQTELEKEYRRVLGEEYGVTFNRLLTLVNMPIQRFGSTLVSKGQIGEYIALLQNNFEEDNLQRVMCRNLISVDWQGWVYDCDFNQVLSLPIRNENGKPTHLSEIDHKWVTMLPVTVADHCYGCTAGQGSSCGGALG